MPSPTVAMYHDVNDRPADETEEGAEHWYAHAVNFVVVMSRVRAGSTLQVTDHPDEYCVVLPTGATPIKVTAGGDEVLANEESLVVVPPGDSRVEALEDGFVHRVLSKRSPLHGRGRTDDSPVHAQVDFVPELVPWPDPAGGFRLRHYPLTDFEHLEGKQRIFRTTNLMIKLAPAKDSRRSPHELSPHSHADFEQASLVVHGEWIHHMRLPWGSDSAQWLDDEHHRIGAPSVTVIPPTVIHTSQSVGQHLNQLIDIFSPPRLDFSLAGRVTNERDYPLPEGVR
jgi:mannose-6-phosphate isomerase-like protein (cupin superfamily)